MAVNFVAIAPSMTLSSQADDEDGKPGKVEEELHRLEDVEGISREAAVQVVDEDHDPGHPGVGEVFECGLQFAERSDVERFRCHILLARRGEGVKCFNSGTRVVFNRNRARDPDRAGKTCRQRLHNPADPACDRPQLWCHIRVFASVRPALLC